MTPHTPYSIPYFFTPKKKIKYRYILLQIRCVRCGNKKLALKTNKDFITLDLFFGVFVMCCRGPYRFRRGRFALLQVFRCARCFDKGPMKIKQITYYNFLAWLKVI